MTPGNRVHRALCAIILATSVVACAGQAPDASRTLTRERINSGEVVPAEALRVGEYLNYYPQHFAEPDSGQIGLDLRLGNPQVNADGGPVWLQIGLQARSDKQTAVAPLNLALVIDCSGSMQDDDKMPYVKEGLMRFLASLAPNDQVALIGYSDEARLLMPSRAVADGSWIADAVQALSPSGNTNISAGLMAGLEEVARNLDTRRNNNVILLTDGIANEGETRPSIIVSGARPYTDRGIHLTTIGLGHDINDALLNELAHQGGGGYHFIDRAQELDHVFRESVTGMVQTAASEVAVTVVPAAGLRLRALTGYDGPPPSGPVTVRLKDMGTGDSQVLLVQLDVSPQRPGPLTLAQVSVAYHDRIAGSQAGATRSAMADMVQGSGNDPLFDTEVLRNVTIQRNAEGLKEIDRLYQAGRHQDAWDLANRLEQDLRRVATLTGERQMSEDADLMRRYQDTLAGWVRQETGRDPGVDAGHGGWASDRGDSTRLLREPTPGPAVIDVR